MTSTELSIENFYNVGEKIELLEREVLNQQYSNFETDEEEAIVKLCWDFIFAPLFNRIYLVAKKYDAVKEKIKERTREYLETNKIEIFESAVKKFPLSKNVPLMFQSRIYRQFLKDFDNLGDFDDKIYEIYYKIFSSRLAKDTAENMIEDSELMNQLLNEFENLTVSEYESVVDDKDLIDFETVSKASMLIDNIVRRKSAQSKELKGKPLLSI